MNIMALESIDFQDGEFFKALTKAVEELRDNKKDCALVEKNFFESDSVMGITEIIKRYTNLAVEITEGGPAIYNLQLTGNHILFDRQAIAEYKELAGHDDSADINNILKIMKLKLIQGHVDLKEGKVYGVFAQIPLHMLVPKDMFCGKNNYTNFNPDEVAAMLLHETGHAFTTMEFCTRSISTNQVIAGLTRALDKSVGEDKRYVIFDKVAKQMDLNKERTKALKEAKTEEQISVIVLDDSIEKSMSELGYSIYDVNSNEYLADQFAARQGATKALVTGLDKYHRLPSPSLTAEMWAVSIYVGFIAAIMTVLSFGLAIPFWFLILVSFTDKKNDIYDNPAARMKRLKLQNVELLKVTTLKPEIKKGLLEENDAIDKVMKEYQDKLGLIEKVAYFLKPSYRNAHKYELLQKELEDFASSDMFSAAAKLKMV
jgi:hypothetical protein